MSKQKSTMPKPQVVNQGEMAWRFPDRQFAGEEKKIPEPAICTRCHAWLDMDHWHYDEEKYRELQGLANVHRTICPGCLSVERGLYEGEVVLRTGDNPADKELMLHLIHNEEARVRVGNPTARIALIEDRGVDIFILTTTQFLARRIGREIQKAFRGNLKIMRLPREKFTRIRWSQ